MDTQKKFIDTRQFIDTEDLTKCVLKYMFSEDFDKAFSATRFALLPDETSKECKEAMRHGMNWAAILLNTSDVRHYYGSIYDVE